MNSTAMLIKQCHEKMLFQNDKKALLANLKES
jgi:hypothetical protein